MAGPSPQLRPFPPIGRGKLAHVTSGQIVLKMHCCTTRCRLDSTTEGIINIFCCCTIDCQNLSLGVIRVLMCCYIVYHVTCGIVTESTSYDFVVSVKSIGGGKTSTIVGV